MKKFSIVKAIDESILRENMYKYQDYMRTTTGDECYYPYIFASNDTIENLSKQIRISICEKPSICNGLLGYYQGNKMFVDNTLKYGEIELR